MVRERNWRAAEWMLALALLAPSLAYSQQPSDSSATQDPGSANPPAQTPTPGTESGATQGEPNPAATTPGLFARALNSASPLAGDNGPLQWGWISVRSASYLQFFNSVSLNNPGLPPQSQDLSASQFSTSIVVSHAFGAARLTQLTVQYAPSLFIAEGHVYTDALNQGAGLDTSFRLSPRLALELSDRFNYYGNQRSFTGMSLGVNYSLGTVAQNSFLNGPGRVIYNSAGASFSYLWSPVTTVSVAPTFGYQNSGGATNGGQNLSALYGGAQVTVSHALSATQTVGISYLGQYATYTNTSTTAGPQRNSVLQDFLLTYSKQIGASWRISAGLGLVSNTNGGSQAGLAASAGITKSFQKMDVALNYNRGHQFNGYVTSESTDRIDLVNTIRWSRRFMTSTSGAYFRTTGSTTAGPSGTYATEQLSFALTRTLSFTSGIGFTKQTGDGVFLQSGHTRQASVGVTWAPAGAVQH